MDLIIKITDEVYKTVQDGSYCGSLYEELKAAIPYNPTGDTISREAINSEIEKRYCDKHCVVPSEEPYCPDICPARFLKNIVKECPAVPERPQCNQIAWEQGFEAGLAQGKHDRPQGEHIRKEDVIALLNKWADGYSYIEIPTEDAIKAIMEFSPKGDKE